MDIVRPGRWRNKEKGQRILAINGNDRWTWTGNDIGAEGARMISEALKINSTLTELNLECDENNNEEIRIRNKEFQQELIIDKWTWTDNNTEAEGAEMISEALKINSTLTELNLMSDEK